MTIEINYRKKSGKKKNIQILNNALLNNQRVNKAIKKGDQKTPQDKWKWNHKVQNLRDAAISFKRKGYSNTGIPQETRKISNNLNLNIKEPEKRTGKAQSQQKSGNNKKAKKMNAIETFKDRRDQQN